MNSVEKTKIKEEKSEMKTLKKFAAVLLLIAALCPVLVFYPAAADADADIIWWSDGSAYEQFQVKGELKTGKNNVLVNDGYLRFNAERAGYYAIDITVDPSESKRGAGFDLIKIDSENKADFVFTDMGVSLWINEVDDGNGFKGMVFYIDKPGTYYARINGTEHIGDKYIEDIKFGCTADVRFLGDFVSVSFNKDTLTIGSDLGGIWHESPKVVGCPCTYTFSDGNTYSGGIIGSVDKLASGNRTLSFNISNGPDIEVTVTLETIVDSIEEVVLPDGYLPSRMYHFDPHELMTDSHFCDVTFIHPEYVELHFKDGTVKKATLDSTETWFENCNNFSCAGEDHFIYSEYLFIEDSKLVYRLSVDNIDIYEEPVKNTVSRISDFKKYLSEVHGLLKSIHIGSLDDTAESIKTVSGEIFDLTKSYIEYLRFIDSKNITAI
ncbi:MAG: hypothetical protein IKR90_06270 [Clostridia bacterium]|nr:hypothetical protein [Clostridia bacterium]